MDGHEGSSSSAVRSSCREESKFIIQWKVANAPKIRRRRRTKQQIEEDRRKALHAGQAAAIPGASPRRPQPSVASTAQQQKRKASSPAAARPLLLPQQPARATDDGVVGPSPSFPYAQLVVLLPERSSRWRADRVRRLKRAVPLARVSGPSGVTRRMSLPDCRRSSDPWTRRPLRRRRRRHRSCQKKH